MSSSPVRTLIAIREPLVAAGLRAVLNEAEGIECLPLPDDLSRVREEAAAHCPDVLVLDVALRRDDPTLVPDIAAASPGTRVLVYVDHSAEECALRHMMELGGRAHLSPDAIRRLDDCCLTSLRNMAVGCIGAGAALADVVRAVRAVAAGKVAAAPWLAAVAQAVHAAGQGPHQSGGITVRELEVMTLLAQGLTNARIAERLGIREQTVKNHVVRLMEKLGVRNRTEMGILAAQHHLRLAADGAQATE